MAAERPPGLVEMHLCFPVEMIPEINDERTRYPDPPSRSEEMRRLVADGLVLWRVMRTKKEALRFHKRQRYRPELYRPR
jgi:hypothetical protein